MPFSSLPAPLFYRAAGVTLLLATCWAFICGPGTAQPAVDPVEGLKVQLTKPAIDATAAFRKQMLENAAQRLVTLRDLRMALALAEWHDTFGNNPKASQVDREVRTAIGQRFQQLVQTVVDKGNTASRTAVADLLGDIGLSIRSLKSADPNGFARTMAGSLVDLTKNDDPLVRQAAARALGKINPDPALAASALADLLKSKDVNDRRTASKALVDMISTVFIYQKKSLNQTGIEATEVLACANEAMRAVSAALHDPDVVARRNGLDTVQNACKVLHELVKEPEGEERRGFPLPPSGDKWNEFDRKLVQDYQAALAAEAGTYMPLVRALQDQGPDYLRLLGDRDAEVRLLARRSFENMSRIRGRLQRIEASVPIEAGKTAPAKAEDYLAGSLKAAAAYFAHPSSETDLGVRRATLDCLEAMEIEAIPALPTVMAALNDRDFIARWQAARILGKIGPSEGNVAQTERMVLGIAKLLNPEEDSDVREMAAISLRRFGPAAKPALPALIAMLNVGEAEAQEAMIKAITGIGGSETTAAIPALVKSLDARGVNVRRLAAEALGRMGPLATSALPALEQHRNDEDGTVRTAVNEAILEIMRPRTPLNGGQVEMR